VQLRTKQNKETTLTSYLDIVLCLQEFKDVFTEHQQRITYWLCHML